MSKKETTLDMKPPNSVDQIEIEIESDDDFERGEDVVTKRKCSAKGNKTSSFVIDKGAVARPKTIYRRGVNDLSYTREDSNFKGKEAPIKCLAEVSFH